MKKTLQVSRQRKHFIWAIFVVALIVAAASWTLARQKEAGTLSAAQDGDAAYNTAMLKPGWSKAILTVSKMTCGGCIATIKKSVTRLAGAGEVNVDLASATAEVMYDPKQITDPQAIAAVITDGGYPAKIRQVITAAQIEADRAQASQSSKAHIARVGRIDIPRKDYEIELNHVRTRYQMIYGADMFSTTQGKELLKRLQAQTAGRLVEEAIKFHEIEKAYPTIGIEKLDRAIADYAEDKNTTLEKLEQEMEANGYPFNHFKKKFGRRLYLQDYLEKNILADTVDQEGRQQRYRNWLANARSRTKVVYYDKEIEALVKSGSSGGCCSSGGGGCSASR